MLSQIYWREPLYLWAMLIPAVLWLLAYLQRRRQWSHIADPSLRPWVEAPPSAVRQGAMRFAMVLAWLLLCVALAGPRTPRWIPPAAQDRATAVLVIDMSASMAARDVRQDRLRYAQAMLTGWLASMPESLRLGIVVYAGHAHRLLRPTADRGLVRHFIGQLDSIVLPTLGNALGDALRLAGRTLTEAGGEPRRRHLLLITDGDLGATAQHAAELAAAEVQASVGARLHVVGVGGPEAVGVPQAGTRPLTVGGERIVSRREAAWLQQFAQGVGGTYRAAQAVRQRPLSEVLDLPPPRIDPADDHLVLWNEWFFVPLLAAVALLMLALHPGGRAQAGAVPVVTLLLALLLGGCDSGRFGNPGQPQADTALAAGEYAKARGLYAGLDGYRARFGEGVACYRLADYTCAARAFGQAAWLAPDDAARGRAVFDLGNAQFRLGDYAQASVLFTEAEGLGVSPALTRLNREFADSLDASVRRRIADIAETERRADWRAQAREMPDALRDRLVEGLQLSRPPVGSSEIVTLDADELKAMIVRGVEHSLGGRSTASTPGRYWVQSSAAHGPQSTAGLFNRLLPLEIGIPGAPDEPYRMKGQRPW